MKTSTQASNIYGIYTHAQTYKHTHTYTHDTQTHMYTHHASTHTHTHMSIRACSPYNKNIVRPESKTSGQTSRETSRQAHNWQADKIEKHTSGQSSTLVNKHNEGLAFRVLVDAKPVLHHVLYIMKQLSVAERSHSRNSASSEITHTTSRGTWQGNQRDA